ncbi:MAG: 6-phosphogluconolactonase, partial [Acidobacteriota bacterium]|nr:6-phosphogluconolactonase [Acidobacteriota bacterium]
MIKIFPNFEELTEFAAEKFVALAQDALKKRKRFTVALSGGSTPKALYALLAGEKFQKAIDWKHVYFFFGDERNVLPDEDESNFLMANDALFQPLNIAADKIYRWHTEIEPPAHIARDYAEHIGNFFKKLPRFDLILLGMGDDGHTASLFPHTSALLELKRIAVANYVEKFDANRLTFTFPTINRAA